MPPPRMPAPCCPRPEAHSWCVLAVVRNRLTGASPPPLFELLEPGLGHVQPAQRRVGVAELRVAVPIGATADGEPEALGDTREPPLDPRGMARVAHLEAVEPLLVKLPDLTLSAVIPEVRCHGDASNPLHQVGDLGERRQPLLDVGRPAPSEVAAECVVDVQRDAALD